MGKFESLLLSPNTDTRQQRTEKMIEYANSLKINGESVFFAEEGSVNIPTGYSGTYEGAKISIIGTDVEFFYGFNAQYGLMATGAYIKNGETYILNPQDQGNDYQGAYAMYATSYIDEGAIILNFSDTHNGRYNLQVGLVNAVGSKKILGYNLSTQWVQSTYSYVDIASMAFIDLNNILSTHTFANMFPYNASAGSLDFLSKSYFKDSTGYKSFTSEYLKACSTMPILETASLPSTLGPHIALGTHCLAPIDIEEEEVEEQ